MGIEGIEHLTGNTEDDFDQSDVDSSTGDERETFEAPTALTVLCEEWWRNPRVTQQGEEIVDHDHVCGLKLNHEEPCTCSCGEVRPTEDYL